MSESICFFSTTWVIKNIFKFHITHALHSSPFSELTQYSLSKPIVTFHAYLCLVICLSLWCPGFLMRRSRAPTFPCLPAQSTPHSTSSTIRLLTGVSFPRSCSQIPLMILMLLLALMFYHSQSTANMYFGHQNRYDCKTSEITSFESLNLLISALQQKNQRTQHIHNHKTYRSFKGKNKLTI